jgi:hypothetical protein
MRVGNQHLPEVGLVYADNKYHNHALYGWVTGNRSAEPGHAAVADDKTARPWALASALTITQWGWGTPRLIAEAREQPLCARA